MQRNEWGSAVPTWYLDLQLSLLVNSFSPQAQPLCFGFPFFKHCFCCAVISCPLSLVSLLLLLFFPVLLLFLRPVLCKYSSISRISASVAPDTASTATSLCADRFLPHLRFLLNLPEAFRDQRCSNRANRYTLSSSRNLDCVTPILLARGFIARTCIPKPHLKR